MDLRVDVTPVTMTEAVHGMRRSFLRAFGRSPVARRLGSSSWSAFQAALLHGSGIAVAASHAQVAATERNSRTMLVAQWTSGRIEHAVRRAVKSAANAA